MIIVCVVIYCMYMQLWLTVTQDCITICSIFCFDNLTDFNVDLVIEVVG